MPSPRPPTTNIGPAVTSAGDPIRRIASMITKAEAPNISSTASKEAKDFGAVGAVRTATGLVDPSGDPGGGERGAEGDDVSGHVPGIGDQSQRLGEQSEDEFDDEEGGDQPERDRESPTVACAHVVIDGTAAAAVGVAVAVTVTVGVIPGVALAGAQRPGSVPRRPRAWSVMSSQP